MQYQTLSLLAMAATALAGKTTITNYCSYPVYMWNIDQSGSGSSMATLAPGSTTQGTMGTTPTSIKLSKTSTLDNNAQTQFEYVITNNQIWYDISFVNCASGQSASNGPGHAGGLSMEAKKSETSCGLFHCGAGAYCPTQAYYVDFPAVKMGMQDPVNACPAAMGTGDDVVLAMAVCADSAPSKKERRSVAGRVWMN